MAFRLSLDKSIERSIRQVAIGQIDRAIREIDDDSISRVEVVHQVRKRCKKLRGLVRLIQPQFDRYGQENVCFRDAARSLSNARDSVAMLKAFDALLSHADRGDASRLATLRSALESSITPGRADDETVCRRLAAFRQTMWLARERVERWSIEATGFDAIAGGWEKTYRRGRCALGQVIDEPTTANLHEWRKRVKYHWYHTRLMQSIWPPMINSRAAVLSALSDLLGDDHDLAVLRAELIEAGSFVAEFQSLDQLIELIDRRRTTMQTKAIGVGRHVYVEKPPSLVKRLRQHCRVSPSRRGAARIAGHAPVTTVDASRPIVEKSDAP